MSAHTEVPISLLSKLVSPPRERSESKKREDEPAQADQEDLGSGSRAASEGQHRAKLRLKRGGMEAKLSRGTQALGTSLAAIPREGGKAGHRWPHAGGRTGFPPTAAGRDRRLRGCHLTGEAKERRCGPKGDSPNSPASLWAPPPLSTSWKWPSTLGHGCCHVSLSDTELASSCPGL